MQWEGEWWLPGTTRRDVGVFRVNESDEPSLELRTNLWTGLRMAGRDDLGLGEDDELLVLVHGESHGRKVTLQGVRRTTPGNHVPSTWAVVRGWEGAHLAEPQRTPVVGIRVGVHALAHWVSRSLGDGEEPVTMAWPGGGTLVLPEKRGWGWAALIYDGARTLEEAEHDAFTLASLEGLLAGQQVSSPRLEARLADGSVVTELVRESRPAAPPLFSVADFGDGLARLVQRCNELRDELPLVLDRLQAAQEPQMALARALLVTSCLEPLFDILYGPTDEDEVAFERRKKRVLRWIFRREDKKWVKACLASPLKFQEKMTRLLAPLQPMLGWSDAEAKVWANNLHGLRVELAHRAEPAYRTNTRWLESAQLGNLGLTMTLYHLWVALGVKPDVAGAAAAAYWGKWQTWVLPSAVEEPLGDRRRMRGRKKSKHGRRRKPKT